MVKVGRNKKNYGHYLQLAKQLGDLPLGSRNNAS
jgi:hypothetical protein